ncbi:hypothetical protein GCM10022198_12600 [Klugiella xanthotipulae]|uniref:Peptidoglycan/LPS O-acetylase OafA/YrhL n=1 Tax=Klugiella xanthotipulae TaxID=244735 RepID=A0A543I434_9MICO|nr:acyltransferase [Klugiella xanthotipulae]TQM65349.1 peptidoglycan/LPS O-acetylase OafA/YrhL [Klugiella xanthotipulae]
MFRAANEISAGRSSRVQIVDYYRFAAAAWVLLFHYFFSGIASGRVTSLDYLSPVPAAIRYGYLGVDLFFLISGFVIVQSVSGKTARSFTVGRFVRLYPAFWVAMLITASIAAFWGTGELAVTGPQVLANLTMVPTWWGENPVDGVYWTLLFELKFYALVGLFVFFRKTAWLGTFMPLWSIGMLLVTLRAPGHAQQIDFLGGYYFLFAGGAIIASIRQSGWSPLRIAGLLASFMGVIPLELTKAFNQARDTVTPMPTVVTVGLIALIYGMLLLTLSRRVSSWTLPGSAFVGALTYPIYLLHASIGYMVLNHLATNENQWLVFPCLILSMVVLAYAVHRVIEVGLKSQWYRFFDATVGRAVGAVEGWAARVRRRVRGGNLVRRG